jgi:environmental stress-induced protein Ves
MADGSGLNARDTGNSLPDNGIKSPGEWFQTSTKIRAAVAFAGDSPCDCISFNIHYSLFNILHRSPSDNILQQA